VTSASRKRSRAAWPVLAVVCCLVCTACGRHVLAEDVSVEWKMAPAPPIVGTPALGEITLRDRARRPVSGARLQVVGLMSHAGMAPIIASVAERGDGLYQVRLQFTMSGDWILLVTGSLPDGRRLSQQIDIANARPAG
jgi:YtkA-like protein